MTPKPPPALDALVFPEAPRSHIVPGIHNTHYASSLRNFLQLGVNVVYDPDLALDQDPESYRKIVAEATIAAKLQKRVRRAVAAGWQIHSKDGRYQGVCDLIETMLGGIQGFRRSLYMLLFQTLLSGFGTARIVGTVVEEQLPGTPMPATWWLPTALYDVSKQRWREHREDPLWVERGWPKSFWALQDVENFEWYRIDMPDSPPGLRRRDYIWAKYAEDEMDLGYAHGLARGLWHKWFMLTHAWMYANDGAESWAKGKIVAKTPKTLGGATLPGEGGISQQQRAQAEIRDKLARQIAQQMSRHVIVLDTEQEYEVFGRPESGHESVKWIVEKIEAELAELILGIDTSQSTRTYDIDPDIVDGDKQLLEDAINEDLIPTLIDTNAPGFAALGWSPEELKRNCKFTLRRNAGSDPETTGKSIQIALAAGAPVHRADVYGGMGLTPVDANSPDALFAPQAGQPIAGGQVSVRQPGQGTADWQAQPNGEPVQQVGGSPSPGGASVPQLNGGGLQLG